MKLVTFVHDNHERAGVRLDEGRIAELALLDAAFDGVSVLDIVREAELFSRLHAVLHGPNPIPSTDTHAEDEVRLLAPIPRPVSMRDGYAFRQHVETARKNRGLGMIPEFDHFPVFYFTNHLAVVGPGELRVGRTRLDKLDFELECFAVIGKRITNPTLEEADDAIFGYGVMNDWSARTVQMEEMKLNLGPAKGKDFATGLGPWLVTKDELAPRLTPSPKGHVLHAEMTGVVNGVELSRGNVNQMNWTFAEIIRRAADGVTLEPGEVVGSGTVGTGCLLELNGSKVRKDQWLVPGDVVGLSIEGLGTLTNTIVEDPTK